MEFVLMSMHRFSTHALILLIHDYVTRMKTKFAHPVHIPRIVHYFLRCEVNDAAWYIVFVRRSRLIPREGRMIYKRF